MKSTSTKTIESIIEETSDAISKTGVNPSRFIDLLAENPLHAFSQYRFIIFQFLYDKYRSEVEIGAYNSELAKYSAMLYEMFYDTEADYRSLVGKQDREYALKAAMVLKEHFGFDELSLKKFKMCLDSKV